MTSGHPLGLLRIPMAFIIGLTVFEGVVNQAERHPGQLSTMAVGPDANLTQLPKPGKLCR